MPRLIDIFSGSFLESEKSPTNTYRVLKKRVEIVINTSQDSLGGSSVFHPVNKGDDRCFLLLLSTLFKHKKRRTMRDRRRCNVGLYENG